MENEVIQVREQSIDLHSPLIGWPLWKNNLLVSFALAGATTFFFYSIFVAYSARKVDEFPKPQFNESHGQFFRQSVESANAFVNATAHLLPYIFAAVAFVWLWTLLGSKVGFFISLGVSLAMLAVYFSRSLLPRQADDFFSAPSHWFDQTSALWFGAFFLFWLGVISAWNVLKPNKQLRARTKVGPLFRTDFP